MTCRCGSQLIINFQAKCDDRSCTTYKSHENDGYVPSGLGIGSGDYIDFSFCGNCGLIQNFVQLDEEYILGILES